MSRKTRKRGRRRLLVIVVLLALIVFGVFARGLLTSISPRLTTTYGNPPRSAAG